MNKRLDYSEMLNDSMNREDELKIQVQFHKREAQKNLERYENLLKSISK